MWKKVEKDCEWESLRVLSVRLHFRDERATPALLEFLEDTSVGRTPGLALLGVGKEEEARLDEIELWPGAEGWEWLEGEEGEPACPGLYI